MANNEEKPAEMFKLDDENDTESAPKDKKSKLDSEFTAPEAGTSANSQPSTSNQLGFVAASPPRFVTMEEIMQAAQGVGNMTLAHEIVVDPDFRFNKQEPPPNSLEARVNSMMKKAFWDILQESLNSQDFSQALQLLEELKQTLLGLLLPQHTRFKTQIEQTLDLDLIKQQVDNGSLDIMGYATFVIGILAQLCAPVRDEKVAQLRTETEVVPLYKGIFELMDVMKMDMANYTVQQIRPYLKQHSIEYERTKFQQFLDKQKESNVDGLQATKAWLKRSALELLDAQPDTAASSYTSTCSHMGNSGTDIDQIKEASTKTPANQSTSAAPAKKTSSSNAKAQPAITPFRILNNAYIELTQWPDNLVFPETLLMDQKRFMIIEKQCNWLSLVTSVLLVTYNTVGASIAGLADFKLKLKELITVLLKGVKESDLKEAMKSIAVQIEKEVNDCLTSHGFKVLDGERAHMLEHQLEALSDTEHAVQKLMSSRVRTFLRDVLSSSRPEVDAQVPTGFSSVTKELSHVTGQFMRLVSHNRSVFGGYYAAIIKELQQEHVELATANLAASTVEKAIAQGQVIAASGAQEQQAAGNEPTPPSAEPMEVGQQSASSGKGSDTRDSKGAVSSGEERQSGSSKEAAVPGNEPVEASKPDP